MGNKVNPMTSFTRRLSRRAKEAAATSAASRDETTRVRRWYVFYSKISIVPLTPLRRLHSDEDAFSASSALALASANAFFFAEDTLGITAPGFFSSGSSYLLFR